MRHELYLHTVELADQIIDLPADGGVLELLVGVEVPEGEEVAFDAHEGEPFDPVVDLLPHGLRVDDELEDPSVLQADQQLVVVLLVHVLVQLLHLPQREVYEGVLGLDEDLVVAEDEGDVFVLAVDEFAAYELVVDQHRRLPLNSLVFLYAQLLPALFRLHVVISGWSGRYLVSASSSLACFLSALSSFPPKLTT